MNLAWKQGDLGPSALSIAFLLSLPSECVWYRPVLLDLLERRLWILSLSVVGVLNGVGCVARVHRTRAFV